MKKHVKGMAVALALISIVGGIYFSCSIKSKADDTDDVSFEKMTDEEKAAYLDNEDNQIILDNTGIEIDMSDAVFADKESNKYDESDMQNITRDAQEKNIKFLEEREHYMQMYGYNQ